ncbi:MAG: MBL fold metallo-hydrolase [Acidobacteriota bacterium]|jgi:glyoxylase-like metal-dependent hydrolase (beta-lactamase superfamily II)
MTAGGLILKQLELGPMMNFVYIVGCEQTRQAAAVDPAWDVKAILATARQLDLHLHHILLTHAHPDHINGLEELLDATDATVYVNAEELVYMREMAPRYQVPIGFLDRRAQNFRAVVDNEEIHIGAIPVRVLHTPGHTPGSQCFLAGKHLLAGDTLFIDACGRVDLPGSDPAKMWWSLNRRLRALDDDLVLYPGHSYGGRSSTLGDQKRTNPYMQFGSADQFVRAMGMGM